MVQLVDMGLPNSTHDQWQPPRHADWIPMISTHPIQFQANQYNSILGPACQDGVLWVTGWEELMAMLRFVMPSLFLLENPTSMHKRLSEVQEC